MESRRYQNRLLWNRMFAQAADAGSPKTIDYDWDHTWSQIQRLDPNATNIIYLKATFVNDFFRRIDEVPGRCIVVSGDEDIPPSKTVVRGVLDQFKIVAWFAQNQDLTHPKCQWLPIGFDFHTKAKEARWGKQLSPDEQEEEILSAPRVAFQDRSAEVVVCFSHSHRERGRARRKFPARRFESAPLPRDELLQLYGRSKFVLSPRGWGYDCHRNWEAYAMGCMVIIRRDEISRHYVAMPNFIVVDKWPQATDELLDRESKRYYQGPFKEIEWQYWWRRIKECKRTGRLASQAPSSDSTRRGFASRYVGKLLKRWI